MESPTFEKFFHSGVNLDLASEEVPVSEYTGAQNFVFRERGSERTGGYATFGSTLSIIDPIFTMMFLTGLDSYWIYCTPDKVFVTDGLTQHDITPTAGLSLSEAGDWTGTTLNGLPVLNNGIDAPIYWNGVFTTPCATLPGWPVGATANSVRAFKYHLIAMGITQDNIEYPHLVWWSNGADPGSVPTSWTPAADNDAGDVLLADTPGKCVDGLQLRDTFIIYKEFSTYVLSYVAGQYVFSARKLFLTSGIQANNCITEINGEHWVLTTNDVIKHDGQTFQSVVTNKVRNALISAIEPSKIKQCCVVSRHNRQQVWVCIPEANNEWLSKAYLINTETGMIGTRDLPQVSYVGRGIVTAPGTSAWDSSAISWDNSTSFWNQQEYDATEDSLIYCSSNADKLFAVDVISSNNGQPVTAYLERTGLPIGDYTQRKLITSIIPRIEGAQGDTIYIRIGAQALFGQPVVWSDPQPFVIGTDTAVQAIVEGRMLGVRFEATTTNIWIVHSYAVRYVYQGLY